MKESTGGALLMGLAAGIIIIFIIMVAFFISYGSTFKIKNEIINYIEQHEGASKDELLTFVTGKQTKYSGKTIKACVNMLDGASVNGFTIKVVVYMEMDKTILNEAFNVKIPIKGETMIIRKGSRYDNLVECPLDDDLDSYTTIIES